MIQIQNNFLQNIDFVKIEDLLNHIQCNLNVTTKKLFMYHIFYHEKICSPFFHIVKPLVQDVSKLETMILYVVPPTAKNEKIFEDTDKPLEIKNNITSLYFINSNNGYVKFFGLDDIYPEQNKLFTFDSNFKINNYTCTNAIFKAFIRVVNTK